MKDKPDIISALHPSSNWVELLTFILMIIGFFTALLTKNEITAYFVIFIFGMISGRMIYTKERSMKSYLILIAGLLAGYLLGSRFGNTILNIVFFIIGNYASYMLHKKKIID